MIAAARLIGVQFDYGQCPRSRAASEEFLQHTFVGVGGCAMATDSALGQHVDDGIWSTSVVGTAAKEAPENAHRILRARCIVSCATMLRAEWALSGR